MTNKIEIPAYAGFERDENNNKLVIKCLVCKASIEECKCVWAAIRNLQESISKFVTYDVIYNYENCRYTWQKGCETLITIMQERLRECEIKVEVHRHASFTERSAADRIILMDEHIKELENNIKLLSHPFEGNTPIPEENKRDIFKETLQIELAHTQDLYNKQIIRSNELEFNLDESKNECQNILNKYNKLLLKYEWLINQSPRNKRLVEEK